MKVNLFTDEEFKKQAIESLNDKKETDLLEEAKRVKQSVKEKTVEASKDALNMQQEIENGIYESSENMFQDLAIETPEEELIKKLDNSKESLSEKTELGEAMTDTKLNSADAEVNDLTNKLLLVVKSQQDRINELESMTVGKMIKRDTANLVKEIADTSKSLVSIARGNISNAISSAKNTIKESFSAMKDYAHDTYNKIKEINAIRKDVWEAEKNISKDLSLASGTAKTKAVDFHIADLESKRQKLQNDFENSRGYKKFVTKLAISDIDYDLSRLKLSSLGLHAKDAAIQKGKDIIDGIKKDTRVLSGKISTSIDNMKETAKELKEFVSEKAEDTKETVIEKKDAVVEKAEAAFEKAKDTVKSAPVRIASEAILAGRAVKNSLSGISAKLDNLAKEATELANAKEQARNAKIEEAVAAAEKENADIDIEVNTPDVADDL